MMVARFDTFKISLVYPATSYVIRSKERTIIYSLLIYWFLVCVLFKYLGMSRTVCVASVVARVCVFAARRGTSGRRPPPPLPPLGLLRTV